LIAVATPQFQISTPIFFAAEFWLGFIFALDRTC
jgi:hypothetical protein